jgi:translocator protein
LFFPAWSILYTLTGFASFRVWYKGGGFKGKAMIPLIAFAVQLILNWIWTPIFFGAQALGFAFVEIVIMWVAIVFTTILFFRVDLIAGFCMLPYIAWISFASTLNYSLWDLNKT